MSMTSWLSPGKSLYVRGLAFARLAFFARLALAGRALRAGRLALRVVVRRVTVLETVVTSCSSGALSVSHVLAAGVQGSDVLGDHGSASDRSAAGAAGISEVGTTTRYSSRTGA